MKTREYGPTYPVHCRQCRNTTYYRLVKVRKWFTLYFMPVVPLGRASWFLVCEVCGEELELPASEQVEAARDLNEATGLFLANKLAAADYEADLRYFERAAGIDPPPGDEVAPATGRSVPPARPEAETTDEARTRESPGIEPGGQGDTGTASTADTRDTHEETTVDRASSETQPARGEAETPPGERAGTTPPAGAGTRRNHDREVPHGGPDPEKSKAGIVLGALLWVVYVVVILSTTPDESARNFAAPVAFIMVAIIGVSGYYDLRYVRRNSPWTPAVAPWLFGMILFFVSGIVAAAYLYRRRTELAKPMHRSPPPASVGLQPGPDRDPGSSRGREDYNRDRDER